mmetsp:Transcript_90564/g.234860  ORF Transcript_90564/g.234860 Transcript_90564/m.234860 type:complete len:209 (-) Transcript_90564:719-1345(-)
MVRQAMKFAQLARLASGARRWGPRLRPTALIARLVPGTMRAVPQPCRAANHAALARGVRSGVRAARALALGVRLAPTSQRSGRQIRAFASDAPLGNTLQSRVNRLAPHAQPVRGMMTSRRQNATFVRRASGRTRLAPCGRAIAPPAQGVRAACQTAVRESRWTSRTSRTPSSTSSSWQKSRQLSPKRLPRHAASTTSLWWTCSGRARA